MEVAPFSRKGHSAFVFNKCLYIFGGINGSENRYFNDLHMYNPVTREWTEVSPQGPPASPGHGQSCNLVKSQLFVFGGMSWDWLGFKPTDLFVLDLSPSLKTLAKVAIIKHGLSTKRLPDKLEGEVSDMAGNISQYRKKKNKK